MSQKAKISALKILETYNGSNPFILMLKRDIIVNGKTDSLNDFNCEYINSNYDFQAKEINKVIKIADWYGEKKKTDWNLDFVPQKLKITYLIGETSTTYNVYVKYRQSVPPTMIFLPKKAVLTNFLVEDFHNISIDFNRYDTLADNSVMFKKKGTLHHILPHQKEAVQFLLSRKKCVLADDMGLGKTSSMIVSAIEGNYDSVVIICPASLKTNWRDELLWYVPERDITIVGGIQNMNKGELEEFLGYAQGKSNMTVAELTAEAKERGKWKDNRFVIINYDILGDVYKIPNSRSKDNIETAYNESPLLEYISNRKSLIIVDEAHTLSDMKSERYKIMKDIVKRGNLSGLFLATGTPITNNPQNYFNLLYLLNDPVTDDWSYYMKRYCGAVEICRDKKERDKWTEIFLNKKNVSEWKYLSTDEKVELREFIKQHCKMITVVKDATNLDELKDRTSHLYLRRVKEDLDALTVEKNVHEIYYSFTPTQWAEYSKLWDEFEELKLNEDPEKEINKDLLEGAVYRKYCSIQMIPNTIKLTEKNLEKGSKVIIICCYDEELYTLQEHFKEKCVIYNGKMKQKEKDNAKDSFINNENIKVFIGNIKSCGVGLNLVCSNVLIFNNFHYTRAINSQAEDRIFRLGQQQNVDVYYQMFIGSEYENIWKIQLRKDTISKSVIKKENEKNN